MWMGGIHQMFGYLTTFCGMSVQAYVAIVVGYVVIPGEPLICRIPFTCGIMPKRELKGQATQNFI